MDNFSVDTILSDPLKKVEFALGGKKRGKDGTWDCPSCGREKQLSVKVSDKGNVLLHCFRGCGLDNILHNIGLTREDLKPDYVIAVGREEEAIEQELMRMYVKAEARQRYQDVYGSKVYEPFSFLGLSDLDDTPLTYRIENLLPTGCNVLFSGYAKTGKSTLVLDLIRALTTKDDFLGSLPCTRTSGTVVYLNLELSDMMLRSYALQNGLELSNSRLRVLSLRGQAGKLRVLDENFRAEFARQLAEQECEVLIVDPLAPIVAMMGISSDDNDKVREVLEGFSEIAELAGIDHVIIVDHTGHEAKGRARGASSKGDWPDAIWNLEANGDSRTLTATGRGVEAKLSIARNPETGRLEVVVPPDVDGGDEKNVLSMLSAEDWTETPELKTLTGLDKSTFSRRMNDLLKQGKVERKDGRGNKPDAWRLCVSGS